MAVFSSSDCIFNQFLRPCKCFKQKISEKSWFWHRGTIAGTAASTSNHSGYTAAKLEVQQLLVAVPGLNDRL
jgi:L-asparaginase/Glu-tRNA(Gln) amidotransferase subunit D